MTERPDGYVQDFSSLWVAYAVEARAGERVLDMCSAPGGKATAMAGSGATVIAADRQEHRAELVRENVDRLELDLPVVVADGTRPPFRPDTFDAVLLDAPCSGLGALRRRADARWRIEPNDVRELARLQAQLLDVGGDARAARWAARLQRVHAARRRVGRPRRRPTGSRSTTPSRRRVAGGDIGRAGECCPRMPTPTAW